MTRSSWRKWFGLRSKPIPEQRSRYRKLTTELLEDRCLLAFAAPVLTDFPTVKNFNGAVVGDFNGDTVPDLAIAVTPEGTNPAGLMIALGTRGADGHGTGTFQAPTFIALETRPGFKTYDGAHNLVVGQMDGDGIDDLVLVDGGFYLKVFYGSSSGLTADNNSTTGLLAAFEGGTVALGHFTSPDLLDVAVLPTNSNIMSFLTNNGDHTFTRASVRPLLFNGNGVGTHGTTAVVEDFDKDGLDDAIITLGTPAPLSSETSILTIKKTNDSDVFRVTAATPAPLGGQLVGGRLDGDDLLDVGVVADTRILFYQGKADGSYQAFPSSPYMGGDSFFATASLVFGSFVGGPAADMVINPRFGILDPNQGTQSFFFNVAAGQGNGNFGTPTSVNRLPPNTFDGNTGAGRLLGADVNGDGTQDLINLYSIFIIQNGTTQVGRASVILNQGGTRPTLTFPDLAEGSPITIAARVDKVVATASGTPTGTVTLKEGNTVLGQLTLSGGQATTPTPLELSAGDHTIVAVYNGDDQFLGSQSIEYKIKVTVNPGRTKTKLDFPNIMEGGPVLIGAFVEKRFPATMGSPGGSIIFKEGEQEIGRASVLGGEALSEPIDLTEGIHMIFGVYQGDGFFTPSTTETYTINVLPPPPPPVPNLGLLRFETDTGGLQFDRATQTFRADGHIGIGLSTSTETLLDLNGSISVNDTTIHGEGTISAHIGSYSATLFQGMFDIPIGAAGTSSLQTFGGFPLPDVARLVGLDISFGEFELVDGGILVHGGLQLPNSLGGIEIPVPISGNVSFRIDADGVSLAGGKLDFPNIPFDLGIFPLQANNLDFSYDKAHDRLKLQGRVTVPKFFNTTADFTGNNFIQVQNGVVSVVGDLLVKDVKITEGFYLRKVKLHIDTIQQIVSVDAHLVIPKNIELEAALGFVQGQLDNAHIGVDNLHFALGTSGVFLEGVSGDVTGLADGPPEPSFNLHGIFSYGGRLHFVLPDWVGGGTFDAAVAQLDLNALIDANHFEGTGTLTLLEGLGATSQATLDINWAQGFGFIHTDTSFLNGIVQTSVDFRAVKRGDVSLVANAQINLPGIHIDPFGLHFFGIDIAPQTLANATVELQFTNDGNFSNDYISLYGAIPVLGLTDIGIQVFFNGEVRFRGLFDPVAQTFPIPAGTEKFLLRAAWENDVGNVPVEIIAPDGTVYTEADFDDTSIGLVPALSGARSKMIALLNPTPGDWTIRIPEETGLGQTQFSSFHPVPRPTVAITSLTAGSTGALIAYDATSSQSETEVTFFYDTDDKGFDGALINPAATATGTSQSYSWDTTGVRAGTYYVYAKIDDGVNQPVWVYFPTPITLADRAPSLTAIADQTVNEDATLILTAVATDADDDDITFTLDAGAPEGASIDPVTGEFSWTPTEAQGAGTYTITVRATDSAAQALSATQSFQVVVAEVNLAPVLHRPSARSINEGGSFAFTVTATDSDGSADTLHFSLDEGAPAGAAIDPVTGAFTWTPSAAQLAGTYPVTIRVTDSGSPALSSAATVSLLIQHVATPGTLQFSAASSSVTEGGLATITVERIGGSDGTVTVHYAAASSSATLGQDFAASSGTLTFANGVTSQSFTVQTSDDSLVEGLEAVSLSLTSPTGGASLGARQRSLLTITDNDTSTPGTIQFAAATFSAAEGAGTATIRATRTGGSSGAVSVGLTVTGGTAASGSDYTLAATNFTFADGQTEATITLNITDDNTVEENETILFGLASPTGGAVLGTQNTATFTLTDNDVAPGGADLAVEQNLSATTVNVGQEVSFNITVTNHGPTEVENFQMNNTLPIGTTFVRAETPLGSFSQQDRTVIFPGGPLAANASVTFKVVASVTSTGTFTNTAVVTSNTSDPSPANNSSSANVTGTTFNPGTLQFSVAAASVAEGAGTATVRVTRTGGSDGLVAASFSVAGTASLGADYSFSTTNLSFAAGQTETTLTITLTDDVAQEANETIIITLFDPHGGASLGTPATMTLTITDNDAPSPTADLSTFQAATPQPVTVGQDITFAIAVQNAGPLTATGVTLTDTFDPNNVSFASATTQQGTFTTSGNKVTFNLGTVAAGDTVNVTVTFHTLAAGSPPNRIDVTSAVTDPILTNNTNILDFGINPPGTVAPGTLSFSNAAFSNTENIPTPRLRVLRTGGSDGAISVDLKVTGGSATQGTDYTLGTTTLTLAAGVLEGTFAINVINDAVMEGDETINFSLVNPTGGASLGTQTTTTFTILDDDTPTQPGTLQFGSPTFSATENSGTATIRLTRTGGSDGPVSVAINVTGGTATNATDYTIPASGVIFSSGQTETTFTFNLVNDTAMEGSETILLSLANATGGATLGTQTTATLTIIDDDSPTQPGTLQFSAPTFTVAENAGTATIRVTRTGGSAGSVSAGFVITGGTATVGTDYTLASSGLTLVEGQTEAIITLNLVKDATAEGNETVTFSLVNPTGGATLGNQSTGTLTITDTTDGTTQPGTLQFGVPSISVGEKAGTATVQVTRIGGSDGTVSAQYVVAVPTGLVLKQQATAGLDYQGELSGTVTFGAGETQKTLSFPIVSDKLVEDTEFFAITLQNPNGGATLGSVTTTTVAIQDANLLVVADATPALTTLQTAGSGFGKSAEHYRDFVTRAYTRFLNRQPDTQGITYWVSLMQLYETSQHTQGLRQEQIEAGFLDSPEYKGRYGGVGEAWIKGIYNDLLQRGGEKGGIDYWMQQLATGVAPTSVALGFTSSQERLENRIKETYRTLLEREADAPGLAYWIAIFQQGGTTEDINSGFVGSPEYYAKANAAAGNPARWVREAYLDILFRPAHEDELAYWLDTLKR